MSIRDGLRPEVPTFAGALSAAGYATAAFVTNVNVAGRWGFANGFDTYEYLPEDENSDTVHVRSDVLTQRAAEWLEHADRNRPFFLYLHATDPHAPYNPPEDVARVWAPDGRCGAGAKDTLARIKRDPEATTPEDLARLRACYDGEIAFTDRSLGRLLDELRRLGRLDDTLVIVTADHGEEFFEHRGFEHGRTLYGELLHVPLVMRFPNGSLRGRRLTTRARQIDVMPTVLEYVGVPIPAEVRGRSLLADIPRPAAAPQVESYAHTRLGGRDLQAITTGQWKVIEGEPGRGLPLQAYDLTSDAGESRNVARQNPLLTDYAREALSTWLADLPLGTDPSIGPSEPAQADPEMLERLRALGYVE